MHQRLTIFAGGNTQILLSPVQSQRPSSSGSDCIEYGGASIPEVRREQEAVQNWVEEDTEEREGRTGKVIKYVCTRWESVDI